MIKTIALTCKQGGYEAPAAESFNELGAIVLCGSFTAPEVTEVEGDFEWE
ncbi:MAG: hypothetical protein J5764_05580 [Bacteroidales bacterium]|nr:hypothetical protein [Bacteroidales bacterium]